MKDTTISAEVEMIDKETEDLLKIADAIQSDYPWAASAIRTKVDVIWDSTQMIAHSADKKEGIADIDGAVDIKAARRIQRAYDNLKRAYEAITGRAPKGSEANGEWVRDNLTQEEWDAKPLVQKLFEASELIAWCLVEIDPDGILKGKRNGR